MRVFMRAAAACLLVGGAIGIAACGSSSSGGGGGGSTIDVYSSLPLQGASSAQTGPLVNGIQLALSQAGGLSLIHI